MRLNLTFAQTVQLVVFFAIQFVVFALLDEVRSDPTVFPTVAWIGALNAFTLIFFIYNVAIANTRSSETKVEEKTKVSYERIPEGIEPAPGDVWEHCESKNRYVILYITNKKYAEHFPDITRSVIFRVLNGSEVYSIRLDDWHGKFVRRSAPSFERYPR